MENDVPVDEMGEGEEKRTYAGYYTVAAEPNDESFVDASLLTQE